jgi:hypothetical protein
MPYTYPTALHLASPVRGSLTTISISPQVVCHSSAQVCGLTCAEWFWSTRFLHTVRYMMSVLALLCIAVTIAGMRIHTYVRR